MMKRAMVLVASAVVACGSTSTPPPPPPVVAIAAPAASTPPVASSTPAREESRQARLLARALKRVELARGLESKKPVPGVLMDRPALIARVKDHVSRELPPEAIRDEGLALQLFGFIPTQFDYEAILRQCAVEWPDAFPVAIDAAVDDRGMQVIAGFRADARQTGLLLGGSILI